MSCTKYAVDVVVYLFRFGHTVLSLDVMDISGETQRDLSHNIVKTRLDSSGTIISDSTSNKLRNDIDVINEQKQAGYCGSCYGGVEPAGGCCNTCDSVREAYVNRGWSFNNPETIEQVRCYSHSMPFGEFNNSVSAWRKAGRTSSRIRRRRDATLLVRFGSARS